jgi:hypothetical protein
LLVALVRELIIKPAILTLTETWLTPDNVKLVKIPGYSLYSCERVSRKGGGVCIFIADNLFVQSVKSDKYESFESITAFIKLTGNQVLKVCVVYRPPNTKVADFLSDFTKLLDLNIPSNNYSSLLICGDFNINLLNVDTNSSVADFVDLIYSYSLFPAIHNPTRVTSQSTSLIDNILMCKLRSVLSGVLCCDISDHLPNFAIFDSLCNNAKPNAEPERFLLKIDYKKCKLT